MKTFLAPNGEYITVPDGRVTTFGLSEEQNKLVENALPTKGYELLDTDAPTDLIAISAAALIINAAALDTESREMMFDYYTEVGDCTDETVFWLGYPKPPHHLRAKFKCYENFEELAANLKYHLLSAHKKSKKAKDFSKQLMDCLLIMKLIRSRPGIRTQELADELELSMRTVQRYISTLQVAGEWIAYDHTKKGWYLQDGVSPLFDNF
jgi:hypothetical protein